MLKRGYFYVERKTQNVKKIDLIKYFAIVIFAVFGFKQAIYQCENK